MILDQNTLMMNSFNNYEKLAMPGEVMNQDYCHNFDNEEHQLLDMDSLVQSSAGIKVDDLVSRIYDVQNSTGTKEESLIGSRIYDVHKNDISLGVDNECPDLSNCLYKPIESWDKQDTRNWLLMAATYVGQAFSQIQSTLIMPGKELLSMSKNDFISRDPMFGERLYSMLHNQAISSAAVNFDYYNTGQDTTVDRSFKTDEERRINISTHNNISDAESDNSIEISTKRPPGRPRLLKTKKNHTSQGKLWEFIRDLLRNRKTCPSLICWEDYSQAKFRFVRSDEVAKLWGSRKGNTKMTYEKLSRAMRYYYKRKIFLPVLGRRLVYQFGPNATGWQTDNPNFRV